MTAKVGHRVVPTQAALLHGPGRFRALLTFAFDSPKQAREAAAALLAEIESPKLAGDHAHAPPPLKILVAVSLEALAGHPDHAKLLEERARALEFDDQPSLLVQVAAEMEDERTYALRLVERVVGQFPYKLRGQIQGGTHLLNREAFGYRDATSPWPESDPVRLSDAVPGASWLFFQQFRQELAKFYELPAAAQDRVMGQQRDPQQPDATPTGGPTSHAVEARQTNDTGRKALILRRSIGYSEFGGAGLAFLATAARPDYLQRALAAFGDRDDLRNFVVPDKDQRGLFVIPPGQEWLMPGVSLPVRPASGTDRPMPEDPFYPAHPLLLYEVTPSSLDFMLKVFHDNKDRFEEGGALRPDLLLMVSGLAKLCYGARIPTGSPLFKLLTAIFATDTCATAFPELADAGAPSDHIAAAVDKLARARETLDREANRVDARAPEDAGNPPVDTATPAELAKEADEGVAVLRKELEKRKRLRDVLGDQADTLLNVTVSELLAGAVIEDAGNIHANPQAKRALATIPVEAEKASGEARALNAFAGKYTTFSA